MMPRGKKGRAWMTIQTSFGEPIEGKSSITRFNSNPFQLDHDQQPILGQPPHHTDSLDVNLTASYDLITDSFTASTSAPSRGTRGHPRQDRSILRITPGLRRLVKHWFNEDIQVGAHDSVEDARMAMRLYLLHRRDWEARYESQLGHWFRLWGLERRPPLPPNLGWHQHKEWLDKSKRTGIAKPLLEPPVIRPHNTNKEESNNHNNTTSHTASISSEANSTFSKSVMDFQPKPIRQQPERETNRMGSRKQQPRGGARVSKKQKETIMVVGVGTKQESKEHRKSTTLQGSRTGNSKKGASRQGFKGIHQQQGSKAAFNNDKNTQHFQEPYSTRRLKSLNQPLAKPPMNSNEDQNNQKTKQRRSKDLDNNTVVGEGEVSTNKMLALKVLRKRQRRQLRCDGKGKVEFFDIVGR